MYKELNWGQLKQLLFFGGKAKKLLQIHEILRQVEKRNRQEIPWLD